MFRLPVHRLSIKDTVWAQLHLKHFRVHYEQHTAATNINRDKWNAQNSLEEDENIFLHSIWKKFYWYIPIYVTFVLSKTMCVCVIYLCHGWPPQSRCSWESLGKPQGNPETKWYHLVLSHHLRIELHDRADTRLAIPTCSSRSSTTICSMVT